MLIHSSENPCPAVVALLEASGLDTSAVCLNIDARDEMLHYCLQNESGSRELALVQYFRAGIDALRSLESVLEARFGSGRDQARILDFASGYGRLTRFLVGRHPPERIRVADIDAEAIAFQERTFGVQGIVSTRAADDLACGDPYDLIFVASLFSHLPRVAFEAWMRRLYGFLAPSGLLLLTVNDQVTMLPGRVIPEDGFYFEALSESELLDLDEYGSTWVTESFMSKAIERIFGAGLAWARLSLGLWHRQDVYLLAEGGGHPNAMGLRRGVEGYLESCDLVRRGSYRFGGWAVDHGGGAVEVELLVNGEVVDRCRAHGPRPDVATLLGDESFVASGWSFDVPAQGRLLRSSNQLLIRAQGNGKPWYVIHCSDLDAAALYTSLLTERAAARRERYLLQQRLAAMEASRFWKLRDRWFQLKTALRLGPPQ